MTLKEKFDNVEIMFESQTGSLKYDELYEASNHCVKIADDYAIGFLEWYFSDEAYSLIHDLILVGELDKNATAKQLLEIFKKEKGL